MNELLTGRYQLLKTFNEGGSSLLYEAIDSHSKQLVVLKFASGTGLGAEKERILREAKAFQRLGHVPGLVRFMGYEENPGHKLGPFLALERLSGSTLNERQETEGTFSQSRAIQTGRKLCKTLDKLHAQGVIHRDISLNNIFLLHDSTEIRLIDLGLALVPRFSGGYEPYDVGKVGTPGTRAPELSDSFPGDVRSDIYSLGLVLHQIVNGRDASPPTHATDAFSAVTVRCSQKSPSLRYQSIREVDNALAAIQTSKITTPVSRAGGVLLLVGIAYSFLGATSKPDPVPQEKSVSVTNKIPTTQPTSMQLPTSSPTTESVPQTPPKKEKKTKTNSAKVVTQASNDDDEIEAAARANLLKLATEPTPISTPKPIEVRVITEKK